jgi:hypothetical protein
MLFHEFTKTFFVHSQLLCPILNLVVLFDVDAGGVLGAFLRFVITHVNVSAWPIQTVLFNDLKEPIEFSAASISAHW